MSYASDVQGLEAGNIVTLFQLDTSKIGGSDEPFCFTTRMREDNYISFDSVSYAALDINASGFLWDGKGAFPTPTLQISNVANLLTAVIIDLKDLVGATLARIRTFEKYLDDGDTPDPDQHFPIDYYTVEQKTKHNKVFVEWKLSSVLDQTGRQVPGRTILRDVCTHTYRIWNAATGTFDYTNATCPFAAAQYYDRTDAATGNPALDKCARRLTSCKKRFGSNGVLPTRAFPGVGKTRV
jgi:lambda family phage minor tail protein L